MPINFSVISMDSVDTVGKVASTGTTFLCCFRPSTHIWPFALTSHLTFKKLGIRVHPGFVPWSGVWLIWDGMYPSCGAETVLLLPPSPLSNHVSLDRDSGSIRGQTDKKLTSTLVIWTFLSFELANIFKSMGVFYFSKNQKILRFPSSSSTTTQTQPPSGYQLGYYDTI